jgi:hypothetical protein
MCTLKVPVVRAGWALEPSFTTTRTRYSPSGALADAFWAFAQTPVADERMMMAPVC